MFRTYFRTTVRTFRRQPGYAALNVAGLALGLAACLLIGAYVVDELSYDRFHADADRIVRVVIDEGGEPDGTFTGPQFALTLPDAFPEIEQTARVLRTRALVAYTDRELGINQRFNEDHVLYVDSSFFDVFDFEFVSGDAGAFAGRDAILLTESAVPRYFDDADPVGKTMTLSNVAERSYTVAGVLADPPSTSHLDFDVVIPYGAYYAEHGIPYEVYSFFWPTGLTYLRLAPGSDIAAMEARMEAYEEELREEQYATQFDVRLERLSDIRLVGGYDAPGTLPQVRAFGAIAVFILLLACINFMNLATARGAQRAKEVGVRKSIGARRGQVAGQFLGEALLMSGLALVLAIGLAQAALPWFNGVAAKELTLGYGTLGFWAALVGIVALTGLLAGSYPALVLSRFQPAAVLKGTVSSGQAGARLRQGLVVFQFTVSVALLIATAVAWQQLTFMREANLGFDDEQVVMLQGTGLEGSWGEDGTPSRYPILKDRLEMLPMVQAVAETGTVPGVSDGGSYTTEVRGTPIGRDGTPVDFVDEDYFDLLGIESIAGRTFGEAYAADVGGMETVTYDDNDFVTVRHVDRGFVVNESFARELIGAPAAGEQLSEDQLEEALGIPLRFYITENDIVYNDYRGTVVGVVPDVHGASLRRAIRPRAYQLDRTPNDTYFLLSRVLVKLQPGPADVALAAIEDVWKTVAPERPFAPEFLDERVEALYRSEARMSEVIGVFALLAVAVAGLGLFGLASYTAERRRKEIGVRKVLGASVPGLVVLLAKDFLLLVALASVLAAPLAWWAMRGWLADFAYRIDLGPGLFLAAISLALVVALATVAGQSLRAARLDPIKSLRHE
ncbi:MAG: ABC transporter permease [Bacteroidota bacterium]